MFAHSVGDPSNTQFITGPDARIGKLTQSGRKITLAAGGKSAWIDFHEHTETVDDHRKVLAQEFRVSELAVSTPAGWRIAVESWTVAKPNAAANADAKAGKAIGFSAFPIDEGDASLRAAFAKLTTDGIDATAAARAELVAIGSGPGERTVGGAGFARAWGAAWAKHMAVDSSIARVAPSGTTGWVAATVSLDKGTGKTAYKIPFLVFCVFDKTAAGDWSLAQIQLTTQ